MNFKTRPHFEDRQLVQYNNESIKLSGTTHIAPTILDFSASTSGQTTVDISGLVGYLNEGREYGLVVEPPLLKISGSTGYTTVDVTGYVLSSVDANGNVGWLPVSGITSTNIYNTSGVISNTTRSVTLNNSNLNITGDSTSIITNSIVSPSTSVTVSQLEDVRTFNGYVSLSGSPVSTGFLAETLSPKIESSLNYFEGILTGDRTTLIVSKGEITVKSDEIGFDGIKYDVDYSSNYDPRSLVDKEYVDNQKPQFINYFEFTGNPVTTIVSPVTWYKLNTNSTTSLFSRGDLVHTNNRVTYTGTTSKVFQIEGIVSVTAGNNQQVHVAFFKNNSLYPCSEQSTVTASGGKSTAVPFHCVIELQTNDYIEVFVKNETAATNITLSNVNVIVKEL